MSRSNESWARSLALVVLAALAAIAVGCGSDDSGDSSGGGGDGGGSKEDIVIGEALGQSGYMTAFDGPASEGAHIAADEINAKGGIDGRKIKFIQADTRSDPAGALQAAQQVIDQGADIMLGACSAVTAIPAARLANQKQMLFFSTCVGEPKVTRLTTGPNALTFDMGNGTNGVGAAAAKGAYDQGLRSAYILHDSKNDYSTALAEYFTRAFENLGGKVTGKETFSSDDPSVDLQASRIKAAGDDVDFVFVASFLPGGASAIRQLRAAGIDMPIWSGDALDGLSLYKAAPNLSDFYMMASASVYGDDPDADVNALFKKMEEKTGKRPDGSYAIFGYSIMQALAKAIEDAGTTDGPKLKEALESFQGVPVAAGPLTYTSKQHMDPFRPEKVITVKNGKPSYYKTIEVDSVPDPFGDGFVDAP